jgi:hypothetical protein
MIRRLIFAGAALAVGASLANAQGVPPFDSLKFDLNGFGGRFYDAPGGAAGGGNILATLDPNGASAATGASPFTGSVQFSAGAGLTSVGSVVGNSLGSVSGPWASAGDGGALAAAGGFLNFDAGRSAGGEIRFSNASGDELVATFDSLAPGPLLFSFGFYDVLAQFSGVTFTDARGDGLFGDPGTGVDISRFAGITSDGFLKIPLMTPNGQTVDWDVVVTVPAPAGALVLGTGLLAGAFRRRR